MHYVKYLVTFVCSSRLQVSYAFDLQVQIRAGIPTGISRYLLATWACIHLYSQLLPSAVQLKERQSGNCGF
jgi:hypothetical protein